MNIKKHALRYLKAGYSIIPVGIDKKPLVNWKTYQYRYPTRKEVKELFSDPKAKGIAVITGKLSGLAVLDFEKDADIPRRKLKGGIRSKSGGGGRHFYYKYPKGVDLFSCTRLLPLMDLRAEGGYIILPPSAHKSGNRYEWIDDIFEYELEEFPSWLYPKYRERRSIAHHIEDVVKGVDQGSRNESATVVIGTLMNYLPYYYWPTFLWPIIVSWNNGNKPPMSLVELRHVFNSIGRRAMNNLRQKKFKERKH